MHLVFCQIYAYALICTAIVQTTNTNNKHKHTNTSTRGETRGLYYGCQTPPPSKKTPAKQYCYSTVTLQPVFPPLHPHPTPKKIKPRMH